ncbi:MAG: OpgC family protein [Beijerinckiaceae bacterium]
MSASIASSIAIHPPQAVSVAAPSRRDLRLDYMRGLALLLIFIDHVSGNRFAALTLQSMGFADAAEVFVFIAGIAGVYAYRKTLLNSGLRIGALAVLRRIRTLYLAHLGMVAGVLAIAALAVAFGTGFDIIGKLGLQPLLDDPVQAAVRLPVLGFLPHYMDILPLYVLLLSTLPLVILGLRAHPLLPLAVAAVVYTSVGATGFNLPSFGSGHGWFLNPFAWALLFVAGATVAELTIRGAWANLPRAAVAAGTLAAAAYVVFAFLHAAPWRIFPVLEPIVALELRLTADKTFLSWHRWLDLAAKAWLVAVLIPPTAAFMRTGMGGAISRAGRNSLPVFVAGTMLSMIGSIALYESGGHALAHIGVTFGGVATLLALAAFLERGGIVAKTAQGSAEGQPATAAAR